MRTSTILLTILAISLATSCSDKSVGPIQPSGIEQQLVGNWVWQKTCGGIAGICSDPSASGTEGITFTQDGISFGWCRVCDPLYSDFKIEQKISYYYGPDTIVTTIVRTFEDSHFVDLIIKQLDDSGLTLIEDCGDCWVNTYSRIRITDPVIFIPDSVGN